MPQLAAAIAGDGTDDDEVHHETDQGVMEELLVEAELLVEDLSIDGMCGVY